MARGFSDPDGKFHPTDKRSGILHSSQLNLKSPSKVLLQQIKQKNIDPQGRFSHVNFRLGKQEKIPLESVLEARNRTFILKGTSPSDKKTVTKIVNLN